LVARVAHAGEIVLLAREVGLSERGLLVFADYVCPYCYLAEAGARRLRQDGVAVEPAAFELRPAGSPLPSPEEAWMRQAWEQTVQPLAAELGVSMRYPVLASRTRKAHEAMAFARAEGAGQHMHDALYAAYWQDGRDIGRIDVLSDIAAEVGLDRSAMRVVLDIDQWADRVGQDLDLARRLRLQGVPAYLLTQSGESEQPVAVEFRTGLQRYDELKTWVNGDDVRADNRGSGA
jgi:predicted DsbA family dithiol-disulfide isomerase